MKKYILSYLLLVSVFLSYAQLPSNGYYRVQNTKTERYVVVLDNRGSLDFATTSADLNALNTLAGFESVVSNPASIIYAEKYNTRDYILYSQGTDTYTIVSQYLKLYDNKDGTYKAYATNSGMTEYIIDEDDVYSPGKVLTGGRTAPTGDWYLNPINNTTENFYFGITPEFTVSDAHYKMFYAAFPFSFASSGMSAYYVSRKGVAMDGFGMVVWKEVTTENIPTATPVIVKCSSLQPSDNKLNILSPSSSSLSGNLLTGVFFCNDVKLDSHRNVVSYDPETMRVLGIMSDGSLGLVTANLSYVPANSAYLSVPKGYPSELKLVNESEYEELMAAHGGEDPSSVVVIRSDIEVKPGIYTLLGTKVSDSNTLPSNLPSGVYIVGGKKVIIP